MTISACVTSIAATGWKAARRWPKRHDGRFEIITWTRTGDERADAQAGSTCRRSDKCGTGSQACAVSMKILVATDAWHPQVNGVVRTLGHVAREARALGAELEFLTPGEFWTLPMPSYPEVRLALPGPGDVERRLDARAAGRHPYRDRRPARPCRAPRLHAARPAVHHQPAHPLSRLSRRNGCRCRSAGPAT